MMEYQFNLSANFTAETEEEAWEQWEAWVSDGVNVGRNTEFVCYPPVDWI